MRQSRCSWQLSTGGGDLEAQSPLFGWKLTTARFWRRTRTATYADAYVEICRRRIGQIAD